MLVPHPHDQHPAKQLHRKPHEKHMLDVRCLRTLTMSKWWELTGHRNMNLDNPTSHTEHARGIDCLRASPIDHHWTDTNPGEAYWPYRIQFSQKGHSNQFRYFMSFIFLRSLDTQTHTWRILITIQNKILTKSTCSRNSMLKSLIVWSSLDTETHTRYRTGVCPATVCSRAPPVQYLVHNCQT